jgi:hypothetical protein
LDQNKNESNGSEQPANDLDRINHAEFSKSETSPTEELELSKFVSQDENTTTETKLLTSPGY